MTTAYYLILIGLLGLILIQGLVDAAPGIVPKQVARNSEGLLFALILSAWIQFVRGREVRGLAPVRVAVGGGVLCLLVAILLLAPGTPSSLKTLNEAFFALAVLIPYVSLRRPLEAWWWALPVLAIAFPVIGANSTQAVALAETFAFLLVVPIALDFADPAILDPSRRRNLVLVGCWLVVVVVVPLVMHVVRPANPQGVVEEVARYLSRTTEAYVAVIVIHLYLSLVGPWATGRERAPQLMTSS